MIRAQNLTKIYGRFIATENVSFQIAKGEIACFLGPNGAGKSTTMKMLTGFLAPTSGVATIAGFDMAVDRVEGARRLGYLPENGPPHSQPGSRTRMTQSGQGNCRHFAIIAGYCYYGCIAAGPCDR